MKPDLANARAEVADAVALRAVKNGTASPDQQRRALDWITLEACEVAGMPWRNDDRSTAFALGRMFVGKQIGRLLTCDLDSLRRQKNVDPPSTTAPTR